jgi:hypothetical protein
MYDIFEYICRTVYTHTHTHTHMYVYIYMYKTMTYLKMYCSSYPMALGAKYSSTFNEAIEYFNDI